MPLADPAADVAPPAGRCLLTELRLGQSGKIVEVRGGDAGVRRRLLELGFCGGARVEAVRRAPMGDPTEYRLRGYCLSLRGDQACCVHVEPDR